MLRYLAEGSLSQNLEQLELGGVGLLRALLDHVGDVDLLDVSIFLQKQGEETDQKLQIWQWVRVFVFFVNSNLVSHRKSQRQRASFTKSLRLQTALLAGKERRKRC